MLVLEGGPPAETTEKDGGAPPGVPSGGGMCTCVGPETETLRLPVIAEYFNNGNWLVNTDDSCTAVAFTQSTGQITLENTSTGNDEQDITGLLSGISGSGTLTNGESANGVIAVGPAMSNGVAVRGSVRIRLDPAAPGANWANHLNIDWDFGYIKVVDSFTTNFIQALFS